MREGARRRDEMTLSLRPQTRGRPVPFTTCTRLQCVCGPPFLLLCSPCYITNDQFASNPESPQTAASTDSGFLIRNGMARQTKGRPSILTVGAMAGEGIYEQRASGRGSGVGARGIGIRSGREWAGGERVDIVDESEHSK